MSTTSLIVISDLHLADGRNVLDGFRAQQQAALEGLLRAALPGGALENVSAPTLIINGDCFDFLAVPPYPADGYSTPLIALEKLEKIAAAHQPFFRALQHFLETEGTVIFLPGNHDIELCFAQVRTRVTQLLDPDGSRETRLIFGLDQSYQPLPDVSIEHGNQYDFWNYASGIWDNQGKVLTPQPERILLPLGTQYMQRAALPISLRYPYFDHFDPPLGTTRQIALLSLFDPELVIACAHDTVKMMSYAHQALQQISPGDEQVPGILFSQAIPDFAAFQQDMHTRIPTWYQVEELLYTPEELEQSQTSSFEEFLTLGAALAQSTDEALQAIFALPASPLNDGTTRGMHRVLSQSPDLHIAIAGHTHNPRYDRPGSGEQIYINTATWVLRQTPPGPEEITPEIVAWLRQPDLENFPLQDQTGFVFALVRAETGKPSLARLGVWKGGLEGNYQFFY